MAALGATRTASQMFITIATQEDANYFTTKVSYQNFHSPLINLEKKGMPDNKFLLRTFIFLPGKTGPLEADIWVSH
jgi:hypothetical protein